MSATTLLLLILIGIAAGFLSGLVGIGGGIIMVPALVFFLGLTQKQAQGTSLGVLMLPVAVSYTHLDVYKRQTLTCFHKFLFLKLLPFAF